MRYFLELSYNGASYHGWQNQPNAISVQETIEHALSVLLKTKTPIVGAGRTDAGVHAKQMFAHFDVENALNKEQLKHRLNSFLPSGIAVLNIIEVTENAHARFDAISRTYEYWISLSKNPFLSQFSYQLHYEPDIEKMNDACRVLFEYTDFQCFSKSNTDVKTYICELMQANWQWQNEKLVFTIQADRFLRNMVRAVVGTLLEVGKGNISKEDVKNIIESKNRSRAGASVPAHALYLTNIAYPKELFQN